MKRRKKDSYAVFLECVLRDDDVLFGDMKNYCSP